MRLSWREREVNADLAITGSGSDWVVVFESRSGRMRNREYAIAVELVIQRFGALDGRLVAAELATRPAMSLAPEERALVIAPEYQYPVELRDVDANQLRGGLARAQQAGNGSNRMRMWISLPAAPTDDQLVLDAVLIGTDTGNPSNSPAAGTTLSGATAGFVPSGSDFASAAQISGSVDLGDSKQAAYDLLHDALGLARRPLAPGGTPHADLFEVAATALRIDTSNCENKVEVARIIVQSCGGTWISGIHDSTTTGSGGGGNITAAGLRTLLSAILETVPSNDLDPAVDALLAGFGQADTVNSLEVRPCAAAPLGIEQVVRRRVRDPRVVATVLRLAGGRCEACGSAGPFEIVTNGRAFRFLEVHHVRPLAEDGSDRPENAVAVCPNCHRALHFAADREARRKRLFEHVPRLQCE